MREIEFGGQKKSPDAIRKLVDAQEVLYDQEWAKKAEDMELYYMYKDLSMNEEEKQVISEHHLRYDITIIPPNMLGVEYTKTVGHYHPLVPNTNLAYIEIYEVLSGEAYYLMQKVEEDKLKDVYVVKAMKGDKVIIPPGYGHITINASSEELKMANWVCRDFSSIYSPIKEKKGGAYFLLNTSWVKNPNYGEVPELRHLKPTNYPELGLEKDSSMYGLVKDLAKLRCVWNPQGYDWLWEKVLT